MLYRFNAPIHAIIDFSNTHAHPPNTPFYSQFTLAGLWVLGEEAEVGSSPGCRQKMEGVFFWVNVTYNHTYPSHLHKQILFAFTLL